MTILHTTIMEQQQTAQMMMRSMRAGRSAALCPLTSVACAQQQGGSKSQQTGGRRWSSGTRLAGRGEEREETGAGEHISAAVC